MATILIQEVISQRQVLVNVREIAPNHNDIAIRYSRWRILQRKLDALYRELGVRATSARKFVRHTGDVMEWTQEVEVCERKSA
ncbi:hypothetical protein ACPV5S_15815 [Vibrio astriarenae]